MEYPKRKQVRLPEYDYSSPGAYFVTICTEGRKSFLSRVAVGEGLAPPAVTLTPIGQIVEKQLLSLPERFPSVEIEKYVIMPNHLHILLSLHDDSGGASPSPTLFDVIRVFKSLSTRLSKELRGDSLLFQRSYHEHVIRGAADYRQFWEYIDTNPAKWAEDRYYTD